MEQWQWRLAINFISQMPDETADIRLVMQYMQELLEWSPPPLPARYEGSNVVPLPPMRRYRYFKQPKELRDAVDEQIKHYEGFS